MRKPVDPRVERTREQLRAAMRSVMEERPLEQISVQHVLDRANVGRTTFYAHYASKDALLEDCFDQLAAWLASHVRSASPRRLAFSLPMFEHAESSRKLYRLLVGKRSSAPVQARVRALVTAAVRTELSREGGLSVPVPVLVEVVAGGYLALLIWWLDHRTKLTPLEMDAMFRRLMEPVLREAGCEEP